jgi:hypothetical protein
MGEAAPARIRPALAKSSRPLTMATFLLDTSVIIDALNNKRNRPAGLLELLEAGHILGCCPINVTEVYAGMRPRGEAATGRLSLASATIRLAWLPPAWRAISSASMAGKALLSIWVPLESSLSCPQTVKGILPAFSLDLRGSWERELQQKRLSQLACCQLNVAHYALEA